jgi:hypothetical protein
MEEDVSEVEETKSMERHDEEKIKKVKFNKEQRKDLIETSKLLREILKKDEGRYIITCLETIPNNDLAPNMLEKLVSSLQYYYPRNVINLMFLCLINPPFVTYEIKEIIQDGEVNKFIDYIYDNYSYRVNKVYKLAIGGKDWQNIRSEPIIRDQGITMVIEIITSDGGQVSFTSPLSGLPILSLHFLRHINRTIDLLKERAISEVPLEEVHDLSNELKSLLERLEKYEKEKSEKETVVGETAVKEP